MLGDAERIALNQNKKRGLLNFLLIFNGLNS
jgi:hypothetical protein